MPQNSTVKPVSGDFDARIRLQSHFYTEGVAASIELGIKMAVLISPAEFTLHRYFLWTNRLYAHFMQSGPPPAERIARKLWLQHSFAYFALWLSLLYVLVEGWEELKLQDPKVGGLIASPNRELLRRFRNGAFHFQPDYFDARFLEFIDGTNDSAAWAKQLHEAIGEGFLNRAALAGVPLPNDE